MEYVVTLERDTNSSYWVRCPDIPEMNSVGDTVEDALKEALDGLETAFTIYMDQRRTIPMPTPTQGNIRFAFQSKWPLKCCCLMK